MGTRTQTYKNRENNGLLSLIMLLPPLKTIKKLQGNPSRRAIKLSPKSPCERMKYILPKMYKSESVSPIFDFGNVIFLGETVDRSANTPSQNLFWVLESNN